MEQKLSAKPRVFYAVGLSYKKADAEMRGRFSLDMTAKEALLEQAKTEGISPVMVISTCNRTEIYGFSEHPFQLISLLCRYSRGTAEDFQKVAYIYKGHEAVSHLFKVGTGLDSQILGDFEIIGQIKAAFTLSRSKGLINNYFERLVNSVIQASKRIKNETSISTGATSVSFASVQYILNTVDQIDNKKILLFGIGKIGRNTCENLVKHTGNKNITLINRTVEKAREVSGKFNLNVKEYADLPTEMKDTDILVVATGAQQPTIDKTKLNSGREILILDLSIPKNVNENVLDVPGVTLVHLDALAKMTDDTLEKRRQFIPQAHAIMDEVKEEFLQWAHARRYAPTIHALKSRLEEIKDNELQYQKKKMQNFNEEQADVISAGIIQKITAHFATHFKKECSDMEESIDWIGRIFQLEPIRNE